MTQPDAYATIRRLAQERLGVPPERLDSAATLREAGIDSLAAIDLVVAVEKALAIRFIDRELESARSLADLAAIAQQAMTRERGE